MIVVKIELWPSGDKSKAKRIGTIAIANDGTGTIAQGNYKCELSHAGKYVNRAGAWKCGYLRGWPRHLSPYDLVRQAIGACMHGTRANSGGGLLIEYAKNDQQE